MLLHDGSEKVTLLMKHTQMAEEIVELKAKQRERDREAMLEEFITCSPPA